MFKKVDAWIVYLIILLSIVSTYGAAVVTRNIGHPFFQSISQEVQFIVDLPKEVYRQFVALQETKISRLPDSLQGLALNTLESGSITLQYSIPLDNNLTRREIVRFQDGSQETLLVTDLPGGVIYLDEDEQYILMISSDEITRYSTANGDFEQEWSVSVPNIHHEKYVSENGYFYSPTYFPLNEYSNQVHESVLSMRDSLLKHGASPYDVTSDLFREDGILVLSDRGEIVHEIGLTEIFANNQMLPYIYGAKALEVDPYHLNSVFPAERSFPENNIEAGDLLLSIRNLSMLLIYRPSTNKVVWHKIGPWSHQHSAKFDEEGNIYVFDNNIFTTNFNRRSEEAEFRNSNGNRILKYDFTDGAVTEFKNKCIAEQDVHTITGGSVYIKNGAMTLTYSSKGIISHCDLHSNKISFFVDLVEGSNNRTNRSITQVQTGD